MNRVVNFCDDVQHALLAAKAAAKVAAIRVEETEGEEKDEVNVGYPLVQELGGKFQFYRYRDGNVVPLSEPDAKSYDPVRREHRFHRRKSRNG